MMRNLILAFVICAFAAPALAQRGSLIEDLFRTIAESQQEQRQRPDTIQGAVPAINVRSRSMAEFAEMLVSFSRSIDRLVVDLRGAASGNPAIRGLMPEAYSVAADARALIARCDGLASPDPIAASYAELDSRYRQLSFSLRTLGGLSKEGTAAVRECDRLVSLLGRQLNLQPQFDRHRLHDLAIIAATHLETLMDDLQLTNLRPGDVGKMSHDIRLARGRLLKEADQIETASYEEVMTDFTEFVRLWSPVSESIYAIGDPHLARRLERIRECGDQSYAVLWMPPPQNTRSLSASAHRLEQSLGELMDQLTIRALVNLEPREQAAVMDKSRRMYRQARELEEALSRGDRREQLVSMFAPIDQDWSQLAIIYDKIQRLGPTTLASVDHELRNLRDGLGLTGGGGRFDPSLLLKAAAAIEGQSEYLAADLRRYERYLQPANYRQSILRSADEFHEHAKHLHQILSDSSSLDVLQREADHLLAAWQTLSQNVGEIERHGLTDRRADSLKRAHADIAPPVAEIAAALLAR